MLKLVRAQVSGISAYYAVMSTPSALARDAWGQGYAREVARATLDWGFANLAEDTIWAITVPANIRSWGLMERLGMTRQIDMDFDHPNVPDDSPLKRHITYNIMRPQ